MDRTSKILLAVVALGLWANAAATVMPNVVRTASAGYLRGRPTEFAKSLEEAVVLLANGNCNNSKLC